MLNYSVKFLRELQNELHDSAGKLAALLVLINLIC